MGGDQLKTNLFPISMLSSTKEIRDTNHTIEPYTINISRVQSHNKTSMVDKL